MNEVATDVERYAAILDTVRFVLTHAVEFLDNLSEGTNGFFCRSEFVTNGFKSSQQGNTSVPASSE